MNALVEEYVNRAYHGMRAQEADFQEQVVRAYDPAIGNVEKMPQEIGRVSINLSNNAFDPVHEKSAVGTRRVVSVGTVSVSANGLSTRRQSRRIEIRIPHVLSSRDLSSN